jgi:hypothetical protein
LPGLFKVEGPENLVIPVTSQLGESPFVAAHVPMIGFPPNLAPSPADALIRSSFKTPPNSAKPWVYWYFMDGNMSREGIKNDLLAMRKAGIGGAIFLEVDLGIPRGPVKYMSPEWKSMVRYAIEEAAKDQIQIALGTGPGWCGTGGPWIQPENAMQHLVSSEIPVLGPAKYSSKLPQPKPRTPFFGLGSMTPELEKQWREFYRDEVVLAIPSPPRPQSITYLDEKSLVYRAPYSSQPGVKPYLFPETDQAPQASVVHSKDVVDLTSKVSRDGTLHWQVPTGKWTVIRFGRTLTGQTTRPAPKLGLGFETDKFETSGIDFHIEHFLDPIVDQLSPSARSGLSLLHFDSWEMGSQNWSAHFRELFKRQRGYDPVRFLPIMAGQIVDSIETSEKFLWDLRQTSQELIEQNHLGTLKRYGHAHGAGLSVEPYDMNPAADLTLGAVADLPQGEFWSKGFGYNTEYSIIEAVSIGHTNGKSIIGAESFTADDGDGWLQHPGSMKAQTDWALAAGINRIIIHRYQHQPVENVFPGMTMGPYGVHWERTETWWNMAPAYHAYISRCQELLRLGLPVADVLYLNPEGAPVVFQSAPGTTVGELPDRRGFNFDGCSPETLIARASVKNGKVVFPDGMSYRLLVLPRVHTMTPRLIEKIRELVNAGASVLGSPPQSSPSLSGGDESSLEVRRIAKKLWSENQRRIGKGNVFEDVATPYRPASIESAQWIWTHEGNPAVAAPLGERTFTKSFILPDDAPIESAKLAFTADNRFSLFVNGRLVGSGYDFHHIQTAEVLSALKPGVNFLKAIVVNEGAVPNPAGLIGNLSIKWRDGRELKVNTDQTWLTSNGGAAMALGRWNMSPWGLTETASGFPPMYPDYAVTAQILRRDLHAVPDLESNDTLRYAHRKVGSDDFYFVANRSKSSLVISAKFRVAHGSPEWWDPMAGTIRRLPAFIRQSETTSIPLRLNGLQSGFVVFRGTKSPAKPAADDFPIYTPVETLDGSWRVSFQTRFGGPAEATFPALIDWSHSSDEHIRFYSGEAHYKKTFDLASVPSKRPYLLSLGVVRNIASVKLNGKILGTTWCAPWQIEIPAELLRRSGNQIDVTVANLWVNRLIGDSRLPPAQRVTWTTWSPYSPDAELQPSGLLGPVEILKSH